MCMGFYRKRLMMLAIVAAVAGATDSVTAQTNYNNRDDKYTVLGLKRAKEAYEYAKTQFEQNKQLFEKQLISKIELDRARNM